MNVGMNIALIVALALAAIADSAKQQLEVDPRSDGVRGHNLNHNETLVRDSTPNLRQDDLSRSQEGEQSFVSQLFVSFYSAGAVCPPWMCNHNETIVRDGALSQRSDNSTPRLSGERWIAWWAFISFSSYGAGGCAPWVCGENHNETLVRDTALRQRSDDSTARLRAARWIAWSAFIGAGGCAPWVCGSNHNETLVRDMALRSNT